MYTEGFTNEQEKAYEVYSWLRKYVVSANVETLRQISAYIARSDCNFDVVNNCKINYRNTANLLFDNVTSSYFELELSNGTKFQFNDDIDTFGFIMTRIDEDITMMTLVTVKNPNDLFTVNVDGVVNVKNSGMYKISSNLDGMTEDSLPFGVIGYYTQEERNSILYDFIKDVDSTSLTNKYSYNFNRSFFDISLQNDIDFDCFEGYLTTVMSRIDLLCDNIKTVKKNRTLFRRK